MTQNVLTSPTSPNLAPGEGHGRANYLARNTPLSYGERGRGEVASGRASEGTSPTESGEVCMTCSCGQSFKSWGRAERHARAERHGRITVNVETRGTR